MEGVIDLSRFRFSRCTARVSDACATVYILVKGAATGHLGEGWRQQPSSSHLSYLRSEPKPRITFTRPTLFHKTHHWTAYAVRCSPNIPAARILEKVRSTDCHSAPLGRPNTPYLHSFFIPFSTYSVTIISSFIAIRSATGHVLHSSPDLVQNVFVLGRFCFHVRKIKITSPYLFITRSNLSACPSRYVFTSPPFWTCRNKPRQSQTPVSPPLRQQHNPVLKGTFLNTSSYLVPSS